MNVEKLNERITFLTTSEKKMELQKVAEKKGLTVSPLTLLIFLYILKNC